MLHFQVFACAISVSLAEDAKSSFVPTTAQTVEPVLMALANVLLVSRVLIAALVNAPMTAANMVVATMELADASQVSVERTVPPQIVPMLALIMVEHNFI